MLREKSCGALVVRRDEEDGKQYLLMIRHKLGGHRSFPKGHMEPGETEYMTAVREVYEETSVKIEISDKFRRTVYYCPRPGTKKEVVYFVARTKPCEVKPREGEIVEVRWVDVDAAGDMLAHANDKKVFLSALEYEKNKTSI
jgi:8-oxo-dGTP pyrophosphatase MutT (NUDIX family)